MEMNALCSSPTLKNPPGTFPSSPSLQGNRPRVSPLLSSESRKVSFCERPPLRRNCVLASTVQLDPSLKVKSKAVDLANELKGTSIFLVGMNGSMKASLGELLADVLRYYYFDSDSLVVQAVGGESAVKPLEENNEKELRSSETEALKQLSSMGRLVVCAGDGAVLSSRNLAYLRHGISVWIDVPLEILAKEAMERGKYSPFTWPISTSDSFPEVLEKLSKHYEELKDGYATADARVNLQNVASAKGYEDVEVVTTEDMAMETLKEIEKLTRVKKMMEAAARPF
ncbi:hypothetical protein H6P81_012388 [Aristolochia fimbriata]|uniref:Inactive shikimate kinase like 1, chloroplastic n=1 Tax=Aristolochia fimbriata TaxID=158543 RepID=A0AAV7EDS8_ARIFI|nr:hypothetical protein H6P81_012388 [Aristolochia fimbriata]